MFSGATTNTPSLGAAQTALQDLPSYTSEMGKLPGLGYAVAYPFGIFGVILAMIATRVMFVRSAVPPPEHPGASTEEGPAPDPTGDADGAAPVQILPIFLGISLGVLLGSIPVPVRGLPAPLRLGLAGGPLVVATALSAVGRIGPLSWHLPVRANFVLRETGIVLFLACVGIRSGDRFVETLVEGAGLHWMAWATLITFVPVMLAAVVATLFLRRSYATVCGMLAGSMTDPPALAFATSVTHSAETTVAYATVYPLTMVLRVLSAQLIVLLFAR
jgi:AspT/YidE/YbjL antiporter-like protein